MNAIRSPQDRQQFVIAVLDKLQLEPCVYSEEQLEAYWSGSLSAEAVQLLESHLFSCEHCTAMASVMKVLAQQLPTLAERAAPAHFTAKVLAATSGLAYNTPHSSSYNNKFDKKSSNQQGGNRRGSNVGRFSKGILGTLLLRPRFAAEAAFCCTLLWTLFAGVPAFNTSMFEKSGQYIAQLSKGFSRELSPALLPVLSPVLSPGIPNNIPQALVERTQTVSTQLLNNSEQLLDKSSELAKAQLQRAQQQLQALYQSNTKRLTNRDSDQPE